MDVKWHMENGCKIAYATSGMQEYVVCFPGYIFGQSHDAEINISVT